MDHIYLTEEEKIIIEIFGGKEDEAVTDEVVERMQLAAEHENDPDRKEMLETLIEKL